MRPVRLGPLLGAGPAPLPEATATVQRRVSSRGGIQVARQRIQVGMTHAGKIVTVAAENNSFRLVIDGETVGVVPRTTSREIARYKAYATHPVLSVTRHEHVASLIVSTAGTVWASRLW